MEHKTGNLECKNKRTLDVVLEPESDREWWNLPDGLFKIGYRKFKFQSEGQQTF